MSQLRMEKANLDEVPDTPLRRGYRLRCYQSGDEAGLAQLYHVCQLGMETPELVAARLIDYPNFHPSRVFIVERGGRIVASACAWAPHWDKLHGYLHMVGVLPKYRGKGLGLAVTVEAIKHTREEGFPAQRLLTDDFRVRAILLYADLGYRPLLTDRTHADRWKRIARRANRPDLIEMSQPA